MYLITFGLLLIIVFFIGFSSITCNHEKDYAVALISKCNYPSEIHKNIQTDDGYLLTMQRIPGRVDEKENKKKRKKTPVLLMHGLFGSAEHFLLLDCGKSLAYMLADQGYDVWLGNVRSVSYSRHHVSLDPDSAAFWEISFDEYGTYDLPRLIDYILETTRHKQIMYIGHSQGNMIFYIMCSNKPEYADKVQLFVNLSPVGTLSNLPHPWLPTVCRHLTQLQSFVNRFGLYEWTLGRNYVREYGVLLCSGIFNRFCKYILYLVTGLNKVHNEDMYRLLTNAPEAIAAKQFIQGCHMHLRKEVVKYDYGSPEQNFEHYGTVQPPQYNHSKTTTPTAMYYARNDWFLAVEDVHEIVKHLPKIVDMYELPGEDFSHLDFIIGRDSSEIVYPRIISLMDKFRKTRLKTIKNHQINHFFIELNAS